MQTDTYNVDLRINNVDQCQPSDNAQKIFYRRTSELSVSVDNLTPYSTYEFYVSAKNELGESQEAFVTVTTGEAGKYYLHHEKSKSTYKFSLHTMAKCRLIGTSAPDRVFNT